MSAISNNSTNSTLSIATSSRPWISADQQFWILLFSNIPSILCCLFVLFHLLSDRILRHALHNHVIIVVLFLTLTCELTDVPWLLFLDRWGVVWQNTPTFCMFWKFIDSTSYVATSKLVAWASIERYILIFHDKWVSTKKKRLFVHYIPLVLVVAYCLIYYGGGIFVLQCNRLFSYNVVYCGFTSCVTSSILPLFEFISGGILCSLIILSFNIILIIRIIRQKRRVHQPIRWRKHRKMTLQLLFITSLFYVFYLPPVVLAVARLLGMPAYIGADYSKLSSQFLSYYITFLVPFACAGSLPQLRTRIKHTIRWCWHRETRAIASQNLPMRVRINNQLP